MTGTRAAGGENWSAGSRPGSERLRWKTFDRRVKMAAGQSWNLLVLVLVGPEPSEEQMEGEGGSRSSVARPPPWKRDGDWGPLHWRRQAGNLLFVWFSFIRRSVQNQKWVWPSLVLTKNQATLWRWLKQGAVTKLELLRFGPEQTFTKVLCLTSPWFSHEVASVKHELKPRIIKLNSNLMLGRFY